MTRDERELALAEALYGIVCQECRGQWPCMTPGSTKPGAFNGDHPSEFFGSGCESGKAEALHALAEAGILVIVEDDGGRVVVARDTDPPWDCARMPEVRR